LSVVRCPKNTRFFGLISINQHKERMESRQGQVRGRDYDSYAGGLGQKEGNLLYSVRKGGKGRWRKEYW
jgi:hypothetical protein